MTGNSSQSAPQRTPRPAVRGSVGRPAAARAAALLAMAAAAIIVLVTAGWQPLLRLDRHIATTLHAQALDHPGWTRTHRILTDWVVDPWTMRALLAVAVAVLWWQRHRLLAVGVAAASAVETASRQVLRWAIGRDRPRWEQPVDSADFAALPSGHAMTAAATCVLLLWLARTAGLCSLGWSTAVAATALIVVTACFTRLFLGVHWLTDTLAGTLLGGAVAAAAIAVLAPAADPERVHAERAAETANRR
jgi:undecaprenyl-diphosphatase